VNEQSYLILLGIAGLGSGILAGFLGIGGGTVLVPILVALGKEPVYAVATSSLAIVITSISGSYQNWRMGYLDLKRVSYMGFPAVVTSQMGVYLAEKFPPHILLASFGLLLLTNIYLVGLRKRVVAQSKEEEPHAPKSNLFLPTVSTGGAAGLLAGLFGVGGGVIMVPLQILLLGESIKVAIQTSLGVIVITAISASVGHALRGNVLFLEGILLGMGGFVGAQISTRILPKLPEQIVSSAFRSTLALLAVYIFWQAWIKYNANA
jgi:uncharacterized protein